MRGDALVVLVDVEAPVQAEELGVHAEEALRVRLAGHELPALFLEGGDIPLADAETGRDIIEGEAAPGARFAKAGPDIEHALRLLDLWTSSVEKSAQRWKRESPLKGAFKWSRGGSNP